MGGAHRRRCSSNSRRVSLSEFHTRSSPSGAAVGLEQGECVTWANWPHLHVHYTKMSEVQFSRERIARWAQQCLLPCFRTFSDGDRWSDSIIGLSGFLCYPLSTFHYPLLWRGAGVV